MRELTDYPVAATPVSVRKTYAFSLLPGAGNGRRKVVINAALIPESRKALHRKRDGFAITGAHRVTVTRRNVAGFDVASAALL
jgi:hypothetical protein